MSTITKKDAMTNAASSLALEKTYKCGQCLHHKKYPHTSMRELCANRGIKNFAVAPKRCFTPDVTQVIGNSDQLLQLAIISASYTSKQRQILVALLQQKNPLPFGTKVYFHGIGADYISNYLAGFVVGTTSCGELIISGSPENNTRGKSFLSYTKDPSSLMTIKEWRVKRAALKAAGKIFDPKSNVRPRTSQTEYEPPTIDSAPAAWHDKQDRELKKRKRSSTPSIIEVS